MTGEEVFHMFQIIDQYYIYPSSGLIHTYSYDGDQYTVKSLILYDGFEEKPLDMKKLIKYVLIIFLQKGENMIFLLNKKNQDLIFSSFFVFFSFFNEFNNKINSKEKVPLIFF